MAVYEWVCEQCTYQLTKRIFRDGYESAKNVKTSTDGD